jgi:hypothetical protein
VDLYQIERAVTLGLSALVLLLIAVYIGFLLPRLNNRAAWPCSLLIAGSLMGASLTGTELISEGLRVCGIALVAAHCGWAWGRRSVRRGSRSAAVSSSRAGVRRAASAARPPAPRPSAAASPPNAMNDTTPWGAAVAPVMGTPHRATLGRYKIEREIGRGAMGAVYLGLDPGLGQQVALKTMALGREFEGEALAEARSRFFREAETAGRLRHPDIVTIYDAGEDRDLAYIAMEYLQGHDLQAYAQPGRLLPVPTVLHIVARVADALAYAHSQGVVHRDVKPANVMVDLSTDTVKVTDFGIAHVTDARRTRTGMVLGTPSFMSPEQMAGGRLDGRSDIYSLGVMLFQLLTGHLPHQAESMARVMYLIANEPAPDIRTVREDLPEALANVVALALEKRPEVRYADGHQVAEDLREVEAWLTPIKAEWELIMPPGEFSPRATPAPQGDVASYPHGAQEFTATVSYLRADTRHNLKN